MTVALENFDDLLRAAREQPERQRFLLVFVKAVLPDGAPADQIARFESRRGGALVPVMYADKGEYELDDFEGLAAEAQHTADTLGGGVETGWDLVVVGCLGGTAAEEPTEQAVDTALQGMLRALRTGQSLSHLIAFDRAGSPVNFF